mmetsp:Transcript_27474/g.40601  ORF Transcript_27474/g.40601 Transcript_27474/m.40601 type:complete len:160 (-) Transcript_27474:232-711(-)|eukprot:CAMPEP_0195507026 /NCGR_PEP_ID=MMETSP0794_2-20130614/556_1 /TAXON_ID=515487 /ORGANISM="Stephanopyxis turris, Strain CCMP 815" /LENGTH=159 /DNA_ID=CAMNT_0040633557 /DNA_START=225 /DNA_END=704 /DNA_ORIENTATION=+
MSRFPYGFSSGFDDFFADPFLTSPMPLLQNFDHTPSMVLKHSSPCYEIHEDEKQFMISVDVPGVKASDMKVQVEHGGKLLRLSGGRKVKDGNQVTESRFEKSFTIGSDIDVNKMKANLSDGVIVVTAPKDLELKKVQQIVITQEPHAELEATKDIKKIG